IRPISQVEKLFKDGIKRFVLSSCPSCSSWFLKDVGKDKPIKGGEALMPTLSGQKEMKLNP
ncbi:MAG: hypothetical protein AB1797_14055, partial [bacterium]